MKTLSGIQTGVAGEYFVAAELSRRGYVASLTLRNTRGIDVLASNADATKSVGIQVKACKGTKADWMLNEKAETDEGANLFYVFVMLPLTGEPSYHVVPSKVVAKSVRESHRLFLNTPRRDGKPHSDTNTIRKFTDLDGKYKDKWNGLGLD